MHSWTNMGAVHLSVGEANANRAVKKYRIQTAVSRNVYAVEKNKFQIQTRHVPIDKEV